MSLFSSSFSTSLYRVLTAGSPPSISLIISNVSRFFRQLISKYNTPTYGAMSELLT